ncbi:MAG: radical SAM protein [Planctomycetaceae bacterium]|jgi:radical SAM superfamily enzyme YgiQ (UPF0313 family)|nr:radical SAM protein [Planctomycetaceae bacterium]
MLPRILFGSIGFPCGLHEIASYVVRLGLAEVIIHPLGDLFLQRLQSFRPHVVGLRLEGGQLENICNQIKNIRQRINTTIILGGPTATSHPIEVLEQTGADYVFAGDAEQSLTQFLKSARKHNSCNDLPDIPGLAYFWAGKAMVNLPPENSLSATQIRVPAVTEEILRKNQLNWLLLEGFDQANPFDSLYLTGGRGCPGRCTFCAGLHGRRIRTKTANQIIEELRGADQLVSEGKLRLTTWKHYAWTENPVLKLLSVSWCSVFDEDFFLDRQRAIQFLQLYEFYGFQRRYRLSFQTNPCSLLDKNGQPDTELFYWISRLKAMIQLGAESFHPELLRRWDKRHTPEQLATVLDALEKTGQDYNIFHILTDYHSTLGELREATQLLINSARKYQRMRIASTPFMIPLYHTELRRELEFLGRLKINHFTDYEIPHPEWMDSFVVQWADKIDEVLQDTLYPQRRDAALEIAEKMLEDI